MHSFTLDDLRAILRDATGDDDGLDIAGDIAGSSYRDLGYDSLALMEVSAQIARVRHVSVPDGALHGDSTPGGTVRLVNELAGGS